MTVQLLLLFKEQQLHDKIVFENYTQIFYTHIFLIRSDKIYKTAHNRNSPEDKFLQHKSVLCSSDSITLPLLKCKFIIFHIRLFIARKT